MNIKLNLENPHNLNVAKKNASKKFPKPHKEMIKYFPNNRQPQKDGTLNR